MLAASPASFQPSNAAIITGSTRRGYGVSDSVLGSRSVIGPAYGAGRTASGSPGPAGNLSGCPTRRSSRRAEPAVRTPASSTPSHERVVVADGAMGTMLQAARTWCSTTSRASRAATRSSTTRGPTSSRDIHRAYFAAGADAVETNTFGANLPNLAEYGIADRIRELAEKGARARPRGGRRDVDAGPAAVRARLGRPGHEAADAGPRVLRPPARRLRRVRPRPDRRRGRRARRRDLPGPAAGQGGRPGRAPGDGRRGPPTCRSSRRSTVETTGTMLLGTRDRRGAHRARAARRRPHRAELRHRARRDERAPAHARPSTRASRCR